MIEEIYARCPEMFAVASDRGEEDWFAAQAHTHERHKFTLFPSMEVLARFRDYHIGGIGLGILDVMDGDLELARFEKIPAENQSKSLFRASATYDMEEAKKVLKPLQGMVSANGYSKEFRDVFLENMMETPDNEQGVRHHQGS